MFDSNGARNDADLTIIYDYLLHTEQEVVSALQRIENRLDNPESIPIYSYRKLMYHLIMLHTILNYNYSICQDKMIQNISMYSREIDSDLLLLPISDFENDAEKALFHEFVKKAKQAMDSPNNSKLFSYNPVDLPKFYEELMEKREYYTRNHIFISNYDVDKLAEMLLKCTPAQLQDFRKIMFLMYRNAAKHEYLDADIQTMKLLKDTVNEKVLTCGNEIDKIVLQQFRWITSNIDEFINNLS